MNDMPLLDEDVTKDAVSVFSCTKPLIKTYHGPLSLMSNDKDYHDPDYQEVFDWGDGLYRWNRKPFTLEDDWFVKIMFCQIAETSTLHLRGPFSWFRWAKAEDLDLATEELVAYCKPAKKLPLVTWHGWRGRIRRWWWRRVLQK